MYTKHVSDGRVFLNLGCGTHMHPAWNNLDFSIYARLRQHMGVVSFLNWLGLISSERFSQFSRVDPDIIIWDLRHGIPFPNQTFDVVYCCHLLEHINKTYVLSFLVECCRVLRPGGVIRVVVPDLEKWTRRYIRSISLCKADNYLREHEEIISELLLQVTQSEPTTRKFQKPLVRWLEKILLGDGEKTGWQHRWMYDRITLKILLETAGFSVCKQTTAWKSRIGGWDVFGLDVNTDGTEYRPGSLYMEAVRQSLSKP
jgi:SAM-dependent methyltransferase